MTTSIGVGGTLLIRSEGIRLAGGETRHCIVACGDTVTTTTQGKGTMRGCLTILLVRQHQPSFRLLSPL